MAPPPMTFKEQMDGFPWAQILVISLVRLTEPIAFSSLFTYVYYMVQDLGVAKEDVSKYTGFLASSFALCQVLTAVFWGKFADKHGRKPTIILGLGGSIISVLLFGVAEKYWVALLARCLMGLVNGNVGVIRTMLGEVAREKKHQALAFAVMPLVWSLGNVIGPLIGGFLSGKETSIGFMKPLVERFPYFRPNFVIALLLLSSALIALFFMKETHYKYQYRRDRFLEVGDKLLISRLGFYPEARPWQSSHDDESVYSIPLRDLSTADSTTESEPSSPMQKKSDHTVHSLPIQWDDIDEHKEATFSEIMTVPVFAAVFSVFLNSSHAVVWDEFAPVFLSSPIARDVKGTLISHLPFKLSGGLGYTSESTGALLSSTGFFTVLFIILVLPYLNRKMDTLVVYKVFNVPVPFIYMIFPYIILTADNPSLSKWLVYLIFTIRSMILNVLSTQINLIVHTCTPPRERAFVNGISIAFGSAAKGAAPFIWGFIMAFGERHGVVWLGWWALAALAIVSLYYSKNLTDEDQDGL